MFSAGKFGSRGLRRMGKSVLYWMGRALELLGLITLPSVIWVAEFRHNETAVITLFAGSVGVFWLGYLLIHFSNKL